MTRRLSDWSKPGEKPPMVGVWETDYLRGRKTVRRCFQYWDGYRWHWADRTVQDAYEMRDASSACKQDAVRFRGLADKPE